MDKLYPTKYTPSPKEMLLDDGFGSLDFTPSLVGEYKIPPLKSKTTKEYIVAPTIDLSYSKKSTNTFVIIELIQLNLILLLLMVH